MSRHLQLATIVCALALNLAASAVCAQVVVVVSAENSVDSLTDSQLADIYLGRSSRFPNGGPAVPIDQSEKAANYAEFYLNYLGRTPAQIRAHWSKLIFTGRGQPPQSVKNDSEMADVVANNPDAIGYLDSELVDDRLQVVTIE